VDAVLAWIPWAAIFIAAIAATTTTTATTAELPRGRQWTIALLVLGYGAALANGQLNVPALIPIAMLIAAAYGAAPTGVARTWQPHLRYLAHAVFIALALALSLHLLPGFHNARVIDAQRFTPDAAPYTMYLNLDKPLAGFWLLLVLPWVHALKKPRQALAAGLWGMAGTAVVCMAVAIALGLIAWAPKLPSASGLWLLNNLLLVSLTEEALFRGYLQGGLTRLFGDRRHAELFALCAASVLFGLAHYSGGWPWMLLGGIAGVGYGLAYRRGGLHAAVLAHFGLNTVHFFLFTYPMLQRAA
jgi:membrane protease YdiL (CAAX protease family)